MSAAAPSSVSALLPAFPWDRLQPYKETAAAHPDGLVDLSVGTPVDPVPPLVREALTAAADSPGYPTVWGTAALRAAILGWAARRLGAEGLTERNVLPVVGSKELVAWLPTQMGLGPGDTVAFPRLAYPTYEVGARLARAEPAVYDDPVTDLDPGPLKLLWLNSPSNPTGRVLGKDELARIVAWAREHDVLVVSDECYLELGWEADPVSVLHPEVCGGSHEGLVAVHSLSKRSNLAGYRSAFILGDAAVLGELLQIRKHGGMMTPAPSRPPPSPPSATTPTWPSSASGTRPAAPPCVRPCSPTASAWSTARPASTCGPPATSPAGTRSPTSPRSASPSPRATSTAPPGTASYGSPSPPRTSA